MRFAILLKKIIKESAILSFQYNRVNLGCWTRKLVYFYNFKFHFVNTYLHVAKINNFTYK